MPVRDTVLTYRLRPQALRDYLRQIFGQEIPVSVRPMAYVRTVAEIKAN